MQDHVHQKPQGSRIENKYCILGNSIDFAKHVERRTGVDIHAHLFAIIRKIIRYFFNHCVSIES